MPKISNTTTQFIDKEWLRCFITEVITDNMAGYNARIESQFEITNLNLDYIKQQTTKTNSRTNSNEDDIGHLKVRINKEYNDLHHKIKDHATDCPLKGEVVILKDQSNRIQGGKEYFKNFLITLVSALTAITLFYGLYKLIT